MPDLIDRLTADLTDRYTIEGQLGSIWVVLTAVHPMFARLRDDPRFRAFIQKLGLR